MTERHAAMTQVRHGVVVTQCVTQRGRSA